MPKFWISSCKDCQKIRLIRHEQFDFSYSVQKGDRLVTMVAITTVPRFLNFPFRIRYWENAGPWQVLPSLLFRDIWKFQRGPGYRFPRGIKDFFKNSKFKIRNSKFKNSSRNQGRFRRLAKLWRKAKESTMDPLCEGFVRWIAKDFIDKLMTP